MPLFDHAADIESWLKVLNADRIAIFAAASTAAKTSDFLAGLQAGHITEGTLWRLHALVG